MQEQRGARWIAHERADRLEAGESVNAQDVSSEGKDPHGGNAPPPGYTLAQRLSYESVLALQSLGFTVRGEISPRGGDRREGSEEG